MHFDLEAQKSPPEQQRQGAVMRGCRRETKDWKSAELPHQVVENILMMMCRLSSS